MKESNCMCDGSICTLPLNASCYFPKIGIYVSVMFPAFWKHSRLFHPYPIYMCQLANFRINILDPHEVRKNPLFILLWPNQSFDRGTNAIRFSTEMTVPINFCSQWRKDQGGIPWGGRGYLPLGSDLGS